MLIARANARFDDEHAFAAVESAIFVDLLFCNENGKGSDEFSRCSASALTLLDLLRAVLAEILELSEQLVRLFDLPPASSAIQPSNTIGLRDRLSQTRIILAQNSYKLNLVELSRLKLELNSTSSALMV